MTFSKTDDSQNALFQTSIYNQFMAARPQSTMQFIAGATKIAVFNSTAGNFYTSSDIAYDGAKVSTEANTSDLKFGTTVMYDLQNAALSGYVSDFWVDLLIPAEATNTLSTAYPAYKFIKKVTVDIGSLDEKIEYTGDELLYYWQLHEPDLDSRTLLHELAGGESATITSATRLSVRLLVPGSMHVHGRVTDAFPLFQVKNNAMKIYITWNDKASIFNVATADTACSHQLQYRVIQKTAAEIPTSQVMLYFPKFYNPGAFSGTYSTTETKFDLSSVCKEGSLSHIMILPVLDSSLAAGTLKPLKTETPTNISFYYSGTKILNIDGVNEYLKYWNFKFPERPVYMHGTEYASNRIICIMAELQKLKPVNGKAVIMPGWGLKGYENLQCGLTFGSSAARTVKFIMVYHSAIMINNGLAKRVIVY